MSNQDDDVATLEGVLEDRERWTAAERCPLRGALAVVGTRSAMILIREALYGTRRFDDFHRRAQITEAVAAARLRELTEAGLLRKEPYREAGQRERAEYLLTDMGRDLAPAVLALMQWGDTWLAGERGAPIEARHTGCDEPLHVEVRCAAGHEVPLGETSVVARSARRPA